MKISCEVIQDLLPLYVEKLASKDSELLIEEHIGECEQCKTTLDRLNNDLSNSISQSTELMPLVMMKKRINARKIRAVSMASLIVFLLMFTVFSYLTKPNYVSYKNSGITITKNENNELYANFSGNITAFKLIKYNSDSNYNIVEIEAWSSILDNILGKSTPGILIASSDSEVDTVYYCDYTVEDNMKIIYGIDPYANGGVITLPRLVLGYYFTLGIVFSLVIGGIWFFVRKKERASQVCKYLFFIPASYVASVIILNTGFVSFSATRDFVMNLIAAVAIYGISMLGISSYRQYREDKRL